MGRLGTEFGSDFGTDLARGPRHVQSISQINRGGAAQMIDGLSSVPFCGPCEARGKLVVAIVVDHKLRGFPRRLDRVRFTRE